MARPKIIKVILDDGSDFEYKERSLAELNEDENLQYSARWHFNNQHKDFEENILAYFNMDLEDWAKDEYDLIQEDEQNDISDFKDKELVDEVLTRHLPINEYNINNVNISNQSFVSRFVEIINRGNDVEIENTLTMLEKNYRIK